MKKALLNFTRRYDIVLVVLIVITLIYCGLFFGHTLLPMYDLGREAYLPQRVLEGQVLYKDLFDLFGPFSYLFTAFIYKLLGSSFHTLYVIGCVNAVLLISGFYKLSQLMLNKKIAFFISLFSIITGISINHCNASYILPYSLAMMYGMIASVWSVYFLMKSEKQQNKQIVNKCLAAFLAGIALVNKYEFVFAAIFIIFYILYDLFHTNKKGCVTAILSFILPIVLSFGYLFYQGLTLQELYKSFLYMMNIALTPSYQNYYRMVGTFFTYENLVSDFIAFLKISIFFALYVFSIKLVKQNNDWGSILFVITTSVLFITFYMFPFYCFTFLPILTVILFLFSYKNLDKISKIFITISILLVYKIIWVLSLRHYGIFFAPILFTSFFLMTKDKIRNILILLLIVIAILMSGTSKVEIKKTDSVMITNDRPLFVKISDAKKINRLILYILENTKPTDKIVIYPEGITVNFITGRKTDDFYYEMGPAYMELLGEENIINHYKKYKPEYFVITSDYMPEYGHTYMCDSYAKKFCNFVENNYNGKVLYNVADSPQEKIIVYKRKDLQ